MLHLTKKGLVLYTGYKAMLIDGLSFP